MKITTMIIVLFVLQLMIMVFDSTAVEDTYSLNPYNITNEAVPNNIYRFMINPSTWSTSGWILFLVVTLGLILVASIIVKSDMVLLYVVFVALIGFGAVPILSLYNLLNRDVGAFVCTTPLPCFATVIISAFIVGPLALYYVMACLEWWSGRPAT